MAKEKLFKPEDFVKDPRNPKNNYTKWVTVGIILLLIVCGIIYGLKSCQNPVPQQTLSIDSTAVEEMTDSIAPTENTDTLKETTEEPSQTQNKIEQQDEPVSIEKGSGVNQPNTVDSNALPVNEPDNNVESKALKVIRGDYGNNPHRKSVLGDEYSVIQKRVNELKRQKAF